MTRFKAVWPERGVDDEASPPGLMVPLKGHNFVLLEGGKGTKLRFRKRYVDVKEIDRSDRKAAAVIAGMRSALEKDDLTTPNWSEAISDIGSGAISGVGLLTSKLLVVKGKRGGMSNIEAVDSSTRQVKAKIVTTVHPKRRVKISFNFLKHIDNSGKFQSLSRWNPANVDKWIKLLNMIFTPQANVVLEKKQSRWVTANHNFGSSVSLEEWDHVTKLRDPGAELNMFLVGTWRGEKGSDPNGSYMKKTKDAVCDDRPSEALLLQTMSHEIGHFLGAGHEPGRKPAKQNWIMASSPRTGSKIIHQWAIHFNPW